MRFPILALLSAGYTHGYELKQAIDNTFGAVGPAINVGQIYTTLSRLERDGLVVSGEVEQSDRPNKRVYELTDDGRSALEHWVRESTSSAKLRDEFFVKLVLAQVAGIAEPADLISCQRQHYLQVLRDLDLAAERTDEDGTGRLLVEGAVLHLQADLKWLDICEEHFVKEVHHERDTEG